jgi:biopolymer transport protein ExbB
MTMDEGSMLGLIHFWREGDAVTHAVAWLLLAMSVASWYVILSKLWGAWRLRRGARAALDRFWAARGLDEAVESLRRDDTEAVFAPMAERALAASRMQPDATLGASVDRAELVTRELRRQMTRTGARLESGLTLLASVGSTAPFVGLFGTVWGIYHALLGIASSGQSTIDRVAGPVGEALVMTAAGLVVAIPAVVAYNAFGRLNRVALAELDGFAHDLLALVTTGRRLERGGTDALHAGHAPVARPDPAAGA